MYGVAWEKMRCSLRQVGEQILAFVFTEFVVLFVPFVRLRQTFSIYRGLLYLVAKLVVEILVKKNLNDNLILVAIVSEAKITTSLFQTIN